MPDILLKAQLHENTRYKQLDSLRGLAAVSVFFSHYAGVFRHFSFTALARTPIGVLFNGPSAVKFFFILSGFVLSLPFLTKDRPFSLIEFYVKRVFRIYPAYILVLIIALVCKYFIFRTNNMILFPDWIRSFWNWNWDRKNIIEICKSFFLIGPKFDTDLISPAIWSLVVEMRMSLFLPFFILIVAKNNFYFNSLFFFVLIFCTYNTTVEYINIFYLGIFLAKYKDYLIDKIRKMPNGVILLLFIVAALLYNSNFEYFSVNPVGKEHLKYYLRDIVIGIGSCIVIMLVIAKQKISTFLEKRIFISLGNLSYSFYLIHMPLLFTACSLFHTDLVVNYFYIFLFTLIGGLVLSTLIYNYVEIPFQRLAKTLIKRFKYLSSINLNDTAIRLLSK